MELTCFLQISVRLSTFDNHNLKKIKLLIYKSMHLVMLLHHPAHCFKWIKTFLVIVKQCLYIWTTDRSTLKIHLLFLWRITCRWYLLFWNTEADFVQRSFQHLCVVCHGAIKKLSSGVPKHCGNLSVIFLSILRT